MSLVNYSCLLCPDNTVSSNVGVAICECLPGYFRAPNESADIGCTRKNTAAVDVSAEISIELYSVHIELEPPKPLITYYWKQLQSCGLHHVKEHSEVAKCLKSSLFISSVSNLSMGLQKTTALPPQACLNFVMHISA